MYVRHLGWLHSVPDAPVGAKGKPDTRSRMKRLLDAGRDLSIPEVRLAYLASYLLEIGPASSGGMGPSPITHLEIRAWQENTRIELTPWEARTLRLLSREYVGELSAATDPNRLAPHVPDEIDTGKVAKDLRSAIAGMAKK